MHRKRTLALLTLLLLIVVASVLLRTTTPTLSVTSTTNDSTSTPPTLSEEKPIEPIDTPVETPALPEPASSTPPAEETPAPVAQKGCYVGGCSSQICSEDRDMVSTCEWRESYACYREATCERQQSGECGWTETPALNTCLMQANSNTSVTY